MNKIACFFSHESIESIRQEQYSLQDINILTDLGFKVIVSNRFRDIPLNCDLYFSWWASGSIFPLLISKLVNKPIIIVAGGNEAMLYKDILLNVPAGYLKSSWYKKAATRLCLKLGSKIIVVSRFMVNDVTLLGANQPIVVYNSVDTKRFYITNSQRNLVSIIFKSDESVVRIKRGEQFIRSIPYILKMFPNQQFVIIGKQGNAFLRLVSIADNLGLNKSLSFVGNIDNSEMPSWLQRSKVYVQISDTETFGLSIAEAMSCGTHVVVSNRGAIPELVGILGVYVDHNDVLSISEGISSILKLEQKEYDRISQLLRKRIEENFSYEIRRDKIKEIISSLL